MKIFISWSGKLSHQFALILDNWIQCVIPNINTFLSSKSIEPGTRWSKKISEELQSCNAGIICLTSENIQSPWINFEAGAISKYIDNSKVIPILINISNKQISKSPLSQFQTLSIKKKDLKKLLISLFEIMEINNTKTKLIFEKWWKELEHQINELEFPKTTNTQKDKYEILLHDFNSLNEGVSNQIHQFKDILQDLTSSNIITSKKTSDKFANLSGLWYNDFTETTYYGIFIENNFYMPYAYENKKKHLAHYHSMKIIGNRIYGRFQWFNADIHGFFYLDIVDKSTLEGEWFFSEDVAFEKLEDMDENNKRGKFISLKRINSDEKPYWIEIYLKRNLHKVIY